MKAKFPNSRTHCENMSAWAGMNTNVRPQARQNSAKCVVELGEPEVVVEEDAKYVKTEMCVCGGGYFAERLFLLTSIC